MVSPILSRAAFAALSLALGLGLGAIFPAQADDSGFLPDYNRLVAEKDPLGRERRVWMSPKFTRANYKKILLEPVTFYPAPQPSDRVSLGTLTDIRNYLNSALRTALSGVVPLADAPGPGVARARVALTAASVDTSLKPYQFIPVAFVFHAAQSATGTAKYDVTLNVESEISDSATGELLVLVVRKVQGVQVEGDAPLTLGVAKPQIDEWAKAVRLVAEARLQK
jgi:hypothetical protein